MNTNPAETMMNATFDAPLIDINGDGPLSTARFLMLETYARCQDGTGTEDAYVAAAEHFDSLLQMEIETLMARRGLTA